jgi:nucleoside-diphosphate-sugar epimerase
VPVDWYGVTKRAGEELIKGLLKRYVIMRYGTTYGPEMRPALCTYIFLKQAIKNESFTIRGDGRQTRNWVYVDDLIDGNIAAMKYILDGGEGMIVNLTGFKAYSVLDLAHICQMIVNNKETISIDSLPDRPDDVIIEHIDNGKARRKLGFTTIDLETGIAKVLIWWSKNGKINYL